MDFIDIKLDDIQLIKKLWEKNRIYHEKSSEYFGSDYQNICFEERMDKFFNLQDKMYKITLCKEKEEIIGYSISTVSNSIGEVESIHVDEGKRGCGIGERLVNNHLQWMRGLECKKIGVNVSQENKKTIKFYKKLGFYPNTLYMEQLSEGS
jgi:ribosomal protein S18 acetylase RimI-like enzyme